MRYSDFQNEQAKGQELFLWTINIKARSLSRISPMRLEDMAVSFPVLNVATANLRSIALRATDDFGQEISFTVDIAVFSDSEAESMKKILNPTIVMVAHEDAELLLIDPLVSISGDSVLNAFLMARD